MAKLKKSGHLLVGKDTLDLFKSLIDALRYEYDYDESTEPMATLVNIYKDTEDCYREMATDVWSAKKSKKIDKSKIAKISMYDMDNLIEALNRIDGTPWTAYIDAEISEYGPPKDFYDIYDVVTTVQEKYDEGYYNNYSASTKKSKMEKYNPDFPTWNVAQEELIEALNESNAVWDRWFNNSASGPIPDEINSPYNGIESDIEQLTVKVKAFTNILRGTSAYKRGYEASTKKSSMKKSENLDDCIVELEQYKEDFFYEGDYDAHSLLDDALNSLYEGDLFNAEKRMDMFLDRHKDPNAQRILQMIMNLKSEDYYASTKKSVPDAKMSFTDNVNKMRVNNYAKTGNINTVMKKRD